MALHHWNSTCPNILTKILILIYGANGVFILISSTETVTMIFIDD